MTRETKAGLVVSCSFLCLVGVVLYCKISGKNPGPDELGSEYVSADAPLDPVPIGDFAGTESGQTAPGSASDISGPALDSEKLAAASSDSKSKSPVPGNHGFSTPESTSNERSEKAAASSSVKESNWQSENNSDTNSNESKTASIQNASPYAIPDTPSTNKNSRTGLNNSDNMDRSAKDSKAGATLDPLADLKENYNQSKTSASSTDGSDNSKSAALPSAENG